MIVRSSKQEPLPVKSVVEIKGSLRPLEHSQLGGSLTSLAGSSVIDAKTDVSLLNDQNSRRVGAMFVEFLRMVFGYGGTFVLMVLLPSIAVAIYLIFLASDQFVAETRFAVRTTSFNLRSSNSPNLASSASGIPIFASQDAYVIGSYIRSAAILKDLPDRLKPDVIYTRPVADSWVRLGDNAGLEEKIRYWRSMTNVYVEQSSGIVTVKVRAFTPEDARDVLQSILEASELLVNQLSIKARKDAMTNAEAEVLKTQQALETSLADMRNLRDKYGMINPVSAAGNVSALLLQAMAQRITLKAQYEVAVRSISLNSPTVKRIQTKLNVLDRQVKDLEAQLTSKNSGAETVSSTIAEFEKLEMRRLFNEKLNGAAQDALERARERAERQNVYVAVFVPPMLPEFAEHPKRFSLAILISFALLTLWGIFALIAAAIGDHKY
jgi:capsular polysaccharide transport system permease protein